MYKPHSVVLVDGKERHRVVRFSAQQGRPGRGDKPFVSAQAPAMVKDVPGHYEHTTVGAVMRSIMSGEWRVKSSTFTRPNERKSRVSA
jgi:hypothetical protein